MHSPTTYTFCKSRGESCHTLFSSGSSCWSDGVLARENYIKKKINHSMQILVKFWLFCRLTRNTNADFLIIVILIKTQSPKNSNFRFLKYFDMFKGTINRNLWAMQWSMETNSLFWVQKILNKIVNEILKIGPLVAKKREINKKFFKSLRNYPKLSNVSESNDQFFNVESWNLCEI